MMAPGCLLALLACVLLSSGVHANVIAVTTLGTAVGHIVSVFNGATYVDIDVWYNIKYAEPPTGDLRFAKTVPATGWQGAYIADELGYICPQSSFNQIALTHPGWNQYSEDCLNLNVYSPSADPPEGGYPVMVWFYGGSYQSGGNIQFPGHFLATYGVVVVTVNYRLGNLGFAYTADGVFPGNSGLWDQQTALEFVQEDIAAFGGDPTKVTVFGQSAGAASTALLTVSPLTKDLFQQAIMLSGTESNMWSINSPSSQPQNYVSQLASGLGCEETTTAGMLTCLRGLQAFDVKNFHITCTPGYFCTGMEPVVDGAGGLLPDWPSDLRAAGDIMKGPIITGVDSEEGSSFTLIMVPDVNSPEGINLTHYLDSLRTGFLDPVSAQLTQQTYDELFNVLAYYYLHWPYTNQGHFNRDAFVQMVTDMAFGAPMDKLLKDQTLHSPSFGYVFDYKSDADTAVPDWMGVMHGAELPFVWGYPLLQVNPAVRLDSGIASDYLPWSYDDIQYSIYMQTLFTNFAKTGQPTPDGVRNPLDSLQTNWEAFSMENLYYLHIGMSPHQWGGGYGQKSFALADYYIPYLTGYDVDGKPAPQLSGATQQSPPAPAANTPRRLPSFCYSDSDEFTVFADAFARQALGQAAYDTWLQERQTM